MKVALIVSALVVAGLASTLPQDELQFAKFREQFGKSYHTKSEHQRRFKIFTENLRKYEAHNRSGAKWSMGVNQFSDLTEAEFEAQHMGGYKSVPMPDTSSTKRQTPAKRAHQLPESVDWRDKGAVSPVKDQQACGSCWAFAATAMIESYAQINTGNMPILSAQQVTACTPNTLHCGGTGGCMGSIPQLAYTYIQLFGHSTEEDWPYTAGGGNTGSCDYDYNGMPPVVGLTGYDTLTPNSQEEVMQHIAEVGPLAVAVYASGWGSYSSGVYDGCSYSSNIALNHAVQLVGYGTDATEGDYWIVRNSWGTRWGEDGYIRLKRDAEAQCGTNSSPMDGTACEGGPGNDAQHVCGQCGVLFDTSYPLGAHEWNYPSP